MAKNYPRDPDDPEVAGTSIQIIPDINKLEVVSLTKRQKVLGYSFIAIALIMLLSYIIPEKYYVREMNILILNIELLVLFARDIYLYFKKSCLLSKSIMVLMAGIYTLNCFDLFFNLKHYMYLELSAVLIVLGLGLYSLFSKKK